MPYPTTIGGGLMGYPSSIDTGQITPFSLETADITVLTATATVAGQAFLSAILLYAPVTATQMRCAFTGSPTGNVDLGIYDATGTNGAPNNLLAHTGAIAATTGLFTQNLTANLALSPGRYWLAFLDTVADSVALRGSQVAGIGAMYKTTATNLTVLPSQLGTLADTTFRIGVMALLSGSFS